VELSEQPADVLLYGGFGDVERTRDVLQTVRAVSA
jgi:hypothetical protein